MPAARPRVFDGPRMTDIALAAEADWVVGEIRDFRERGWAIAGGQFWTHAPSRLRARTALLSELKRIHDDGGAIVFQVSVTGLGGTPLERGIGGTIAEMDALDEVRAAVGIAPEHVSIRFDPIQRWRERGRGRLIENFPSREEVLSLGARRGYRRWKTSVIEFSRYAPFIQPRMEALGVDFTPFGAGEIEEMGARLLDDSRRLGIRIESCACALGALPAGACFDPAWMASLARSPVPRATLAEPTNRAIAPRAGCRCVSPAGAVVVKVTRQAPCPFGCLACYAG